MVSEKNYCVTFKLLILFQEGKLMGAKFTMLTHFSQRYAKMPLLAEIEGQPNVGIAFDTMSVNPRTFNLIPSLFPALAR